MTTMIREGLPVVACRAWCEYGDGHPGESHPDDQWCGSEPERVTLTREPLVEVDSDTWALDDMRAYVMQGKYEAEPRVHLGRGESHGVYLTPGEARALGEALVRLADTAESTHAD